MDSPFRTPPRCSNSFFSIVHLWKAQAICRSAVVEWQEAGTILEGNCSLLPWPSFPCGILLPSRGLPNAQWETNYDWDYVQWFGDWGHGHWKDFCGPEWAVWNKRVLEGGLRSRASQGLVTALLLVYHIYIYVLYTLKVRVPQRRANKGMIWESSPQPQIAGGY